MYSQFTRVLDNIGDWLSAQKLSYERIDGSVPGAQRQALPPTQP